MKFSLFYVPQVGMGDPTSYARRNIGNDPAQYSYMLQDVKLQAQIADDAGFYGVYFAEHHFDSEGFEMCHNPLLLDLWVGMHTRQIKLGQFGLALPTWNPLRLAEDIATLVHIFADRIELGFVRGAFGREVAPLASAHQVGAGTSNQSEGDERNRRLFVENYEILIKALTEDFIRFEGEFHTIPPKGLTWVNPATQKYGGGVDPDGIVTHLAVVPKLPDRKLPRRWQCFSYSPETMRWAAREGMNLAMFTPNPQMQRAYQEMFLEEAEKGGRTLAYGEGIAYVRNMLCLEDGEEARRYDAAACERLWGEWFAFGGFVEAFRRPEDDPDTPIPYSYQRIHEGGYAMAGTPDEVSRQIETLLENTSCEHLALQYNTGGVPRDVLLRSLELFASKVMPRFDVA